MCLLECMFVALQSFEVLRLPIKFKRKRVEMRTLHSGRFICQQSRLRNVVVPIGHGS
jgi:hypothetical protein